MATVTRENIGLLNDKLTVTLNREDYYPAFEKSIKQYSKTANIPGFRKGMVPAGMIRKMYGASLLNDEIIRTAEKQLMGYLSNERPDIFAQPLPLDNNLSAIGLDDAGDVVFDFEIGLKPAYQLPDLSKASLVLHKVKVTDDMVEEEIKRMQMKGGEMTEADTIDNEENVLNILFTEADEAGNAVEGGISKENSVLLKYFSPAIKAQLMGKRKDDSIVFTLADSFEGDMLGTMLQDLGFEKDDAAAAQKKFKLDIAKIGLLKKRELEETFFNEVYPGKAIATEAEFRQQLAEEIAQYWDGQSRNQLHDQLYHYLLDETQMEFPADFLKRWLQVSGENPKTAEQAEAEYPNFSNSLKWTLLSDRITQENNLDISEEELRAYMKADIMRYFGQMQLGDDTSWIESYVDRMMKDEKQADGTYRRLLTEKLFNHLQQQVTPAEKSVTPEELAALQHNHSH